MTYVVDAYRLIHDENTYDYADRVMRELREEEAEVRFHQRIAEQFRRMAEAEAKLTPAERTARGWDKFDNTEMPF